MSGKEYLIHKALHEESNEGWVWLTDEESRKIIKITNPTSNKDIFCYARKIDNDFRRIYNNYPYRKRREISDSENTIVIHSRYRDLLGIAPENIYEKHKLIVTDGTFWRSKHLAELRAAFQHPDRFVRLATTLGMIGIWLGIVSLLGFIESIFSLFIEPENFCAKLIVKGILTLLALTTAFIFWIMRSDT